MVRNSGDEGICNGAITYGVFRTVPTKPPTAPDSKLFRISVALSYMPRSVSTQSGWTFTGTYRWFGQQGFDLKDRSKVPSIPPKVSPERGFHSGVKTENALFSNDSL